MMSQLHFITVTVFVKRLSTVRLSSSSVSFTSAGYVRHMPACFGLWMQLLLASYCCVVVFYCWFHTVNMVICWWWFCTAVWLFFIVGFLLLIWLFVGGGFVLLCGCWCRTVMWYVVSFVVLCGCLLFSYYMVVCCRSQWPPGLRRGCAAARFLGLRVRISPGHECLSLVRCCVFSGRGLCVGPITRTVESYRVWCV